MTRNIIAALVALGIISAIAVPAFAHRPTVAPQTDKGFVGTDVWDKAQARGK